MKIIIFTNKPFLSLSGVSSTSDLKSDSNVAETLFYFEPQSKSNKDYEDILLALESRKREMHSHNIHKKDFRQIKMFANKPC
jgi:hypothetical protein